MLISKEVEVKWNGYTSKWYKDKGYTYTKQGDIFICKIEDLRPTSTVKVLVDCDYKQSGCKGIHNKPYRQYTEDLKNKCGNCCTNKKCGAYKTKDILLNKYGVDNIQKLDKYKIESSEKRRKPFDLFKKLAIAKNLILITKEHEYKNKMSRIKFICIKHSIFGEQETNAEAFLNNIGCCFYNKGELCANSTRLDGTIVYNSFINKGLIPKFNPKDYNKNNQLLPFICPNHIDKGIQKTNYVTLLASPHKCKYCGREATSKALMLDENFVFEYFRSRKLIIDDNEKYLGKDNHVNFICPVHPEYLQSTSYNGLQNTKQPCLYCRIEKSLKSLNRSLRSSLSNWKKESKLKCNNKCILTGSKSYEVHHLYTFNNIILDTLKFLNIDIKNKYEPEEFIKIKDAIIDFHNKNLGICLDRKLHILYHQIYSKENNTIDQFNEFKERIKTGEFDRFLESNNLILIR